MLPKTRMTKERPKAPTKSESYILDSQVGFVLRQAQQRHTTIFSSLMVEGLTPTQWAALSKLKEIGPSSQNLLGRLTAMDAATIKGVIDRLTKRRFTEVRPDPEDARLLMVQLTPRGRRVIERATVEAFEITEETLAPLNGRERAALLALLRKLT